MKSQKVVFITNGLFKKELKENAAMKLPHCVLIGKVYIRNRTKLRFKSKVSTISVHCEIMSWK